MPITQRIVPRQRPKVGRFTAADQAKLNSIEFGANIGGFPDIDEENIPVSSQESVLNFTNAVSVVDQGFQTDIVIAEEIDGGNF